MPNSVTSQPSFNLKSSKSYMCRIIVLVSLAFGALTISMSPPISPRDTQPFAPKAISFAETVAPMSDTVSIR